RGRLGTSSSWVKQRAREGGGGGARGSDPDPTSLPGMAALSWRSLNQLNQISSSLRKGCWRPQQDLYIAIRFKTDGLRNHQGLGSGQRSLRPTARGLRRRRSSGPHCSIGEPWLPDRHAGVPYSFV